MLEHLHLLSSAPPSMLQGLCPSCKAGHWTGHPPAAGVMTTKPTTAPTQAPVALNLRPRMWSSSSQVPMAAAAAMLVVRNAWQARALAPRALPPLNYRGQGAEPVRGSSHKWRVTETGYVSMHTTLPRGGRDPLRDVLLPVAGTCRLADCAAPRTLLEL